jgi:hypothetical protein
LASEALASAIVIVEATRVRVFGGGDPVGLESPSVASTVRQDPPVSDGDPGSEQDARGASRTRTVASLATALAEAVLAGDDERARALAEELRAAQARPAAPRLRRAR